MAQSCQFCGKGAATTIALPGPGYGVQIVVCLSCWDELQAIVADSINAMRDRKVLDKISGETENSPKENVTPRRMMR